MIALPSGVRVWIAAGHSDMRRGMHSLALQVQEVLKRNPHAGDLYVFRGRSGSLIKILWHDGIGMSLYAKRLERGRFIWPTPADGSVAITAAQHQHPIIDFLSRSDLLQFARDESLRAVLRIWPGNDLREMLDEEMVPGSSADDDEPWDQKLSSHEQQRLAGLTRQERLDVVRKHALEVRRSLRPACANVRARTDGCP